MFSTLQRVFFLGIITVTPLALTIWLIVNLFQWFDGVFQPFIEPYLGRSIPGFGFVIGIAFIFLVGLLAPSLIGRQFINLMEAIVKKLPLVKLIYSGTKQIFDSFSDKGLRKFSRVVMIPFPKEGTYVIGFVTKETQEGWVPGHPENKLSVFIPTTPNPTSGYLAFVKESEAISIDIPVEEALKVVISGGLVRPSEMEDAVSEN